MRNYFKFIYIMYNFKNLKNKNILYLRIYNKENENCKF